MIRFALLTVLLLAGCSTPSSMPEPRKLNYKLQYSKSPSVDDPRIVFSLRNEYEKPVKNAYIKLYSTNLGKEAGCITDESGLCGVHLVNQFNIGGVPTLSSGMYKFKVSIAINSHDVPCDCNYVVPGASFIPRVFEVTDETARIFYGQARSKASAKIVNKGQFFQINNPNLGFGNYVNVCSSFGSVWLNAGSGRSAYAVPSKENTCQ